MERVQHVLEKLGLHRHPENGVWGEGATRIEHLGFVLDSEDSESTLKTISEMVFRVPPEKSSQIIWLMMRRQAGALLRAAGQGIRARLSR